MLMLNTEFDARRRGAEKRRGGASGSSGNYSLIVSAPGSSRREEALPGWLTLTRRVP
jgi:hypothetical protein